jgi:hypothetical protein
MAKRNERDDVLGVWTVKMEHASLEEMIGKSQEINYYHGAPLK